MGYDGDACAERATLNALAVRAAFRAKGINPTQYYGWKKQLVSSATKVFNDSRDSKPSAKEQRMESDLRRAKDVIAEITAENLELKKGLSD